jgi:Vitamin K-dependent gamma-carboxylase
VNDELSVAAFCRSWFAEASRGWNRFWFVPRSPATLCMLRILTGLMLVYTHLVWTLELETFLGNHGILERDLAREMQGESPFVWSHYEWSDSPLWLWGTHLAGIGVMILFTAGCWTRVTGIVSALLAISCAHRAGGALFGLDQINCMLAMYLAIGPSGAMYSVDAWRKARGGKGGVSRVVAPVEPLQSTMATVATRLIQLHLCVIYLFAGWGKLAGAAWWNGTALWGAIASYEYQTIPLTFLADFPLLINALTLVTIFWECAYPFLVWPRLSRPLVILMAVLVHLGIGLCMGMMTFGIIMVIANLAFIEPGITERLFRRLAPAGRGSGACDS